MKNINANNNIQEHEDKTLVHEKRNCLINHIKATLECSKEEAESIVAVVKENLLEALSLGEEINIKGLGSFKAKKIPQKKVYDQKTGRIIQKAAQIKPIFKFDKELKSYMQAL